jgi:RNA polymerase sigma-70 factor (ECF subfamily)
MPKEAENAAVFDGMYSRYRNAAFSYLLGKTGCRASALDLMQETFLRLWRNIDAARKVPEERRLFYVLCLARSVHADEARRSALRAHLRAPMTPGIAETTSVEQEAEHRLLVGEIDRAVAGLPPDLRTAFTMSVLGGMDSAAIGEAIGRPAGTVRAWIHEARRRIAQEVGL